MNREIKFRGKHADNDNWVFGLLYQYQGKLYITNEVIEHPSHSDPAGTWIYNEYEVDPNTVGQFTYLQDKNGKDIYHKDIVNDGKTIFVVDWNQQQTAYWLSPINPVTNEDWVLTHLENQPLGNGYFSRKDLEIIGNSFDNPELLNQ